MKNVLDFINQASREDLTAVPGITVGLAESLMEGRPFTSAEEVLQVKGIGPNLLDRIKTAADAKVISEERGISGDAERSITVPSYERPLRSYEPARSEPKAQGGFRRFMRGLFRALLWLALIAGIGAAAWAAVTYGLPYIQRTFIDPLNANTAQIEEIAAQQAEDLAALDERILAIDNQLELIEVDLAGKDERIAQLASDLAALEESSNAGQQALAAQIREETEIIYALELIDRARLYLSQSNFGLAREDIMLASERLSGLLEEVDESREIQLSKVIDRLDLASSILPEYPVVAANDLEIAWYLLIGAQP
jgi:hypothetical protein